MMQQTGAGDAQGQAGSSGGPGDRLNREKQDARTAAHDIRDEVASKAEHLASDVKAAAGEKIEDAQHGIGAGLKSIGGAFRAAGEHLSSENQSTASRMANDAASSIDRLSDSLQNRSFEEIVGDLRSFGRNNAGGLFAGSLLAGLALGRLAKLSVKSESTGGGSGSASSTGGGSTGDWSTGSAGTDATGGSSGGVARGSSFGASGGGSGTDFGGSRSGSTGSGVAGSQSAQTAGSAGGGPVGSPATDPVRPAAGREPAGTGAAGSAGFTRPNATTTAGTGGTP